MADTKLTALTDENTDPQPADILYIVDDPAGTPNPEKITGATLRDAFEDGGGLELVAISATNLTAGTIPAARIGADTIDAITEIASALKSGADSTLITGTAGTSGDLSAWNADGDLVDGPTPPSGDIVGTTDSQALTNKTIDTASNTITVVEADISDLAHTTDAGDLASGTLPADRLGADSIDTITEIAAALKSGSDGTLVTGTAGTSGDLVLWDANGDAVDGPTPPSGDIVGTTDTQTLTAKSLGDFLELLEQSADPASPAEGAMRIWRSNGTSALGLSDGDVGIMSTAGGVTRGGILFRFTSGDVVS